MYNRRQFIKLGLGMAAGITSFLSPMFSAVRWVYAKSEKIILPKTTSRESLIDKDPGKLDTRNLEITELEDFETMGATDLVVDMETWRLEVNGNVKKPLGLTYEEILELPSIERDVLLICPGFFANNGRWKGVSMKDLLERAGLDEKVKSMTVSGQESWGEKTEEFPLEDLLSNKVFLAYGVNNETLPVRNGFPLRIVAEGYYGDDWVKYVKTLTFK